MTVGSMAANQPVQNLSKITELAKQLADQLGLVLLGVRMGQQGRNRSLEITIYRKEPAISFSDCEQMSRSLEHLIKSEEADQYGFSEGTYLFEVVSPGADRQLTSAFEFNLFAGSQIRIVAREKIPFLGTDFIATLIGGDEQSVTISHGYVLPAKGAVKLAKPKLKTQTTNDSTQTELSNTLTITLQQVYRIQLWPGS